MTRQNEDSSPSAASDALDQVVRESRTDLLPPKGLGVAGVEAALFVRIAEERSQSDALARYKGSARWGWGVVGGLAAAAAMVLAFGRGGPSASSTGAAREATLAAAESAEASTFTVKRGAGDVMVGREGAMAAVGKHVGLTTGDVVETHGAEVVWKAGDKATWLVEDASRVAVRQSAPLVLRLERGALEAQVTPVPSGEAFAVDVGDERIAVHGTHLRVARAGDRVTVDLTEGVVTIGRPPRTGTTYGTLVMAPAHVEFEIGDVAGSLILTHEASAVRPADAFASVTVATVAPTVRSTQTDAPAPAAPRPVTGGGPAGHTAPPAHHATEAEAAPAAVDPGAEDTVAAAVRSCVANAPHSSEVTVTVSSSLELTVGDDGFVSKARFNPPLAPEVQSCASASIFKTRFAKAGEHKVDIVLQR
jgi:hypothetical protein